MSGIRDLGFEFNQEVDKQGDLLINAAEDLETANINTNQGAKELNKYAERMKGKGFKMIICLGILVLVLLFLIYLIFK